MEGYQSKSASRATVHHHHHHHHHHELAEPLVCFSAADGRTVGQKEHDQRSTHASLHLTPLSVVWETSQVDVVAAREECETFQKEILQKGRSRMFPSGDCGRCSIANFLLKRAAAAYKGRPSSTKSFNWIGLLLLCSFHVLPSIRASQKVLILFSSKS